MPEEGAGESGALNERRRIMNSFWGGILWSALVFGIITSCSDSSEPEKQDWGSLGIQQVEVLQYEIPPVLDSEDTLSVFIEGTTQGRPVFSHFEADRNSFRIELTAWAQAWKWTGSGVCPPYDPTVRCEYLAEPPHYPGYVTVVLNQPDGSALTDSVLVE